MRNDSNTNHHDNNYKEMADQTKEAKENSSTGLCFKGKKGKGKNSFKTQSQSNTETVSYLWKTIMSEHIETRKKLKEIADISSFSSLIQSATLSDIDKQIVLLHYIDEKDFRYIGDMLGFSESTIKKRHKKILMKLSRIL